MAGKFGTFGVGIDLPGPALAALLEDPKASLFDQIAKTVGEVAQTDGLFGPSKDQRKLAHEKALIRERLDADKELEKYKQGLKPTYRVLAEDGGARTVMADSAYPEDDRDAVEAAVDDRLGGIGGEPAVSSTVQEGASGTDLDDRRAVQDQLDAYERIRGKPLPGDDTAVDQQVAAYNAVRAGGPPTVLPGQAPELAPQAPQAPDGRALPATQGMAAAPSQVAPQAIIQAHQAKIDSLSADLRKLENAAYMTGETTDPAQAREWRSHNDKLKTTAARTRLAISQARLEMARDIEKYAEKGEADRARQAKAEIVRETVRGTSSEEYVRTLDESGQLDNLPDGIVTALVTRAYQERQESIDARERVPVALNAFVARYGRPPTDFERAVVEQAAMSGKESLDVTFSALKDGTRLADEAQERDQLIQLHKIPESDAAKLLTLDQAKGYVAARDKQKAELVAAEKRMADIDSHFGTQTRAPTMAEISRRRSEIKSIESEIRSIEAKYYGKGEPEADPLIPAPEAEDRIKELKRQAASAKRSFNKWLEALLVSEAKKPEGMPRIFTDRALVPEPFEEDSMARRTVGVAR